MSKDIFAFDCRFLLRKNFNFKTAKHSKVRDFYARQEKRTYCKMMQYALKFWIYLHPADVGAVIDRPRAIDNRPYGFYRKMILFCNRPFLTKYCGKRSILERIKSLCAPAFLADVLFVMPAMLWIEKFFANSLRF